MFGLVLSLFALLSLSLSAPLNNTSNDKLLLINSNNELAFDLFHTIITTDNNHFISPLLIFGSFAGLLTRTQQQTNQELRHLLHIGNVSEISSEMKSDLKEALNQTKSAKRLYVSDKFPLKPNLSENQFIESVNFDTNARNVTKSINKFVEEKTDSKISNLFRDSLPQESKMVLVNAVYSSNQWKSQFDLSAEKSEFFNSQSSSVIETIETKAEIRAQPISELNAQLIEVPLNNNQTFYILLPNENDGLDDTSEKLTLQTLQQSIESLKKSKPNKIQLFLPKFKIESEYDFRELCDDLDCKTLFTDSAQFVDISDEKGLRLSSAIHHSVFEVNESGVGEGVPPQAVPSSDDALSSAPQITPDSEPEYQELRVDHPFVFFISSNGLVVFVGQVRTLINEQILSYGFI